MAKGRKTGGRPPGGQNKATQEFKATITDLLAQNTDNVSRWLRIVAEGNGSEIAIAMREGMPVPKALDPDPGKALDLVSRLAEYAYPKLARTELTGKDGEPLQATFKTVYEKP